MSRNELEIVTGNYVDKYSSRNPLVRWMMQGFLTSFRASLSHLDPERIQSICEVGCAEGELLKQLHQLFPEAALYATDISPEEIEKARQNCADISINFSVQDAENLTQYDDKAFDLVICCEVLEHLPHPAAGFAELNRISRTAILVSVPNEPVWRILNVMRGKYWKDRGNTPGHLNHWSMSQFPSFLSQQSEFVIHSRKHPFPWQMLLLQHFE